MGLNLDTSISIADLASATVGIIALRVALKNRRSPLREMVYERQLNVFQELFNRLAEFGDEVSAWEMEKRMPSRSPEVLEEIEERIFKTADEFQIHLHKVEIFIPRQVHRQFGELLDDINVIKVLIRTKEMVSIDTNGLGESVFALKNEIRKFMGLDNLASETHKLTSK